MRDNYTPVLKMLGERNPVDSNSMAWFALIAVLLPILLLLGNYLRHALQRRKNLARGYDHLEKIGNEKGLTYPEQMTAEQIAAVSDLNNPALLLGSVEIFDRAVAAWMKHVMQLPWLEMDTQIARVRSIRQKADFRYLSPERPPVSTRELKIGQKIYSLAASKKGLRLISAEIIDIDDLALVTTPFQTGSRSLQLSKTHDIWGFFWSEGGGEYRFRTRLMKEVTRPAHYQMLSHGDELFHDADCEIFTCNRDIELVADWISAARYGGNLSPNSYDRVESPPTLAVYLTRLSGSGYVLAFDEKIEPDDLLRIRGGDNTPPFLADSIGKVMKISDEGIRIKFLKKDADAHHHLLHDIAGRLSASSFNKRLHLKPAPHPHTPS